MNETDNPQDDNLRGWLREQGRAAERRAPGFPRVWRAAGELRKQSDAPVWENWALWTIATVAVVLAGVVMSLVVRTPEKPGVAAPKQEGVVVSLTQSGGAFDPLTPTDFLLTANAEPTETSVAQLAREIDLLLKP